MGSTPGKQDEAVVTDLADKGQPTEEPGDTPT